MKYIRLLIPYLDDILVACALISFVTASYLINAVLGTYILGIAFLVAAFFTGVWLQSPIAMKILNKVQKLKIRWQAHKRSKGSDAN